jgi:hypothetical protein
MAGMETRGRRPFQFSLWRLIASVTLLAIAGGLFRYAHDQIDSSGLELFALFLLHLSAASIVAAVSLVSSRVWKIVERRFLGVDP